MLTFEFSGAEGRMRQSTALTSGMAGKRVKFSFSPEWEGLHKTAVFSAGGVTRDVVEAGDEAVIPARVLEKPLVPLYVGIYGTNDAGDLVIPTVWVQGPVIKPGANPSGDPSTAPELPVWEQILCLIGSLEKLDTEARENLVAAINELAGIRRELQSDWNQGDSDRADYIRNRTHWMRDSRVTLSWNGTREGRPVVYLPSRNRWYCRIGEQTPASRELTGGTVVLRTGKTTSTQAITGTIQGEKACLAGSGTVLVVYGNTFTLEQETVTAPDTGIYAWFDHLNPADCLISLSWGQQRFLRLDDRFIPVSIPRKEDVGFIPGSQQAQLLLTLLQNASFQNDQSANLSALAQSLAVEPSGPSRVTLTGLTVVYSGGDVPAGTPLTALTGIYVMANFSDGSGESITGYTLSGSVREGSNTITVIYQGQTAEFTVVGTGSSQEGTAPVGWLVTLELTGCTADRSDGYVTGDLPLAVRLTADEGYTLENAQVRVVMGGTDITATAYANGLVTIPAVTGDVVITAGAPEK